VRRFVEQLLKFRSTASYWERRYAQGGNSGSGSQGHLGAFKAEIVNEIVAELEPSSVLELGCGDGSQLALLHYPRYTGLDVSPSAVAQCQDLFRNDASKSFAVYDPEAFDASPPPVHEMAVSLDVVYHIVENSAYERYLRHLFASSARWVLVYSSNTEDNEGSPVHVRHRRFTDWVARTRPDWQLVKHVPNRFPAESSAEFFLFERAR